VSGFCHGWLACLAAYAGDTVAAGAHQDAATEAVLGSGDAQGEAAVSMFGVVAAAVRNDAAALEAHADRLESAVTAAPQFADHCAGGAAWELVEAGRVDQLRRMLSVARSAGPWDRARRLQVEAVLAAFDGDHDRAVDAAMQSIEICESLGHVFDPIRSRIIAARSLVALGRDAEAGSLLNQAIADAESIGASRLVDEARSLFGGEAQQVAAER